MSSFYKVGKSLGFARIVAIVALLLTAATAFISGKPVPLGPTIANMPRRENDSRVFLDHADILHKQSVDSFMVISGNVKFTKGPMIMFCDSAHFFPASESFDAFGNVRMEQGDTLFIYADELNYRASQQMAFLYADPGKKVRMINRDVTLETDEFIYDLGIEVGYYNTGGVLYDKQNRLTSIEGEYVPATKDANFYSDVVLFSHGDSDTLVIFSDSLFYNTDTHIAILQSPSEIINKRGTIYTSDGMYDTVLDTAALYMQSVIHTPEGRTLTADTIYYDRIQGRGECFGNMLMTDSVHQSSLFADYGFFYDPIDSAYATGSLLIKEYSQGDTLYLHGKQINIHRLITENQIEVPLDSAVIADSLALDSSYVAVPQIIIEKDTTSVADIWPRVRFYRSDMQGLCDSMRITQSDSTLRMYIKPVVWSGERQITGTVIEFHVNDSTIDFARVPEQGFMAERLSGDFYNQMSGKEFIARFVDGNLRQLDINGNVEFIMYPEENDSTINKQVNATSSFMTALFSKNNTEYVKLWPETGGKVTPLFLIRRSMLFLPKFKWLNGIRPLSPSDVMIVPPEMDALMEEVDG